MSSRMPQAAVDFTTLNPGLHDLHEVADQCGAALSQFKGCSVECAKKSKPECCRDKTVSQQEFELIASAMPADFMYRTATDITANQRSVGWCPFLTAAGECGVYEWRPLECRAIGTVEPAPSSCNGVEKVPAAIHARRSVIREALYRLRAVVVGPGPRRPLSEWLQEFKAARDVASFNARMPR